MRIVFMGTPDFSVPVLEKLCQTFDVCAVYTRAPKESGRGKKLNKTPVHLFAEKNGIEVRTPKTLKDAKEQERLAALHADMAIVAAYGLILPQAVLDMFPLGAVNVHASLLPRWRGAAPIQRAIEAGDGKSGISIMKMAAALDAGDVISQEAIDITPSMTGGDLHDKLSELGAFLLVRTLKEPERFVAWAQDERLVTYAEKISKEECLLDFNQNALALCNKIRAFAPFPATYFIYHNERFKVYLAETVNLQGKAGEILAGEKELVIAAGDIAVSIKKIQREGKQVMDIEELLRGFKFEEGYCI